MHVNLEEVIDPLAAHTDRSMRVPGSVQGWVLISTSWLAVMASAVIAPVLPRMTTAFRGTAHEPVLIALVATVPALFIALLAWPSGWLADRVGRRTVLVGGLVAYGFFGTAPLWIVSLPAIVTSRALVGVAEAMITTCGATLLGDYFLSRERDKWFAWQTASANVAGMVLVGVGGLLGERGWRVPFFCYTLAFLLLPLVLLTIWEPGRRVSKELLTYDSAIQEQTFRWKGLIGICLLSVFASTAFYIVIVQLSFLLTERGFASPRLIGPATGLALITMPIGALLFKSLRTGFSAKLALSFALSGTGFFILALSRGYATTIAGAAITGLGSGLVLPTLVTWALSELPAKFRGRGTGAWQSSFALGTFLSPLVILGLANILGGRSRAVLVYAFTCCAFALAFLFNLRGRRNTE